jgi:hypothetical protein
MKSNFLKTIYKFGLITEQDEETPPSPGEGDVDAEGTTGEEGTGEEGERKVDKLSPESEVLLIRLLKKAMIMILDEEDIDLLDQLDEINEENAKEALRTLVNTMKKYSTEIDIRTR